MDRFPPDIDSGARLCDLTDDQLRRLAGFLMARFRGATTEDFSAQGKAGGKRRAERLTPERRREIARMGGVAPRKAKRDTAEPPM